MNKSGVLSNIHDSLLPHLATLNASLDAQDRKQERAKMIIADAVLNGAGFIPLLGPLLGLSVAVVKNIEREIEASYESGIEHTPESISNSAQNNLSDQVSRRYGESYASAFAPNGAATGDSFKTLERGREGRKIEPNAHTHVAIRRKE